MVLRKLSQALGAIGKGWAVDTILGGFPVSQVWNAPDAASTNAVLGSTALSASAQTVTAGITDPDYFRCLSIKGNASGMSQNVVINGKDWAGFAISEQLTLSGTNTVNGNKPFASVDAIILPAQTAGGQQVQVGITSKLGLYRPLLNDSSSSVQMLLRGTSKESSTIDATNDTIIPNTAPNGANDYTVHYLTELF